MNRVDMQKFFGVSGTTILNWERRGAPIESGDVSAVAEWRARRDIELSGFRGEEVATLPRLAGELALRIVDIEKRMARADAIPIKKRDMAWVVTAYALLLERLLLELPGKVLSRARPETVPVVLHEAVFQALNEARGISPGLPGNIRNATRRRQDR